MSGVQHVTVESTAGGQRIDNFLRRHLHGVPRALVYRLVRKGQVRVNGGRIRPDYRIQAGDSIRIPPVQTDSRSDAPPPKAILERLEHCVLHETDELLVINKPAGLAVHGGSGLAYGIVEAFRRLRPQVRVLDLAHRLDRQTSGCLVLCKTRAALTAVHDQFREGTVDKRYLTLMAGRLPRGPLPVEARLAKRTGRGGEREIRVAADGKQARTVFTVRERFRDWTLAEAELITGRMHQIRVHAVHAGHPVAGDPRYGDAGRNEAAGRLGLRRLFLHAWRLRLRAPNGEPLSLEAPLADDLSACLEQMRDE